MKIAVAISQSERSERSERSRRLWGRRQAHRTLRLLYEVVDRPAKRGRDCAQGDFGSYLGHA
jgi:hypothetical protein